MKKGYKRLLIFEIILFFILFLNSFVWNILNGYFQMFFLILLIIFFKRIYGLEKDRHRYTKDAIYDIIIFLLIYFIFYYLLGLVIGFAKTTNYYSLNGFLKFIVPTAVNIILKEYFRYNVASKAEGNRLLVILTCLNFIILDVTNILYYNNFASKYDSFVFVALYLLPAISTNIVCTYLTYKVGYKPNIVYLFFTIMYVYFVPIIPNLNEYLYAIINFVLPIILYYKFLNFFNKIKDDDISRDYKKKKILFLIIPVVIVMILVYFTSGYFKYFAVAIASGSMTPNINKGDVVIIKKIGKDYNILEKGVVIAYKYNGVVVVHRIREILKAEDGYYIYTKGDANDKQDNYVVREDMVIGIVNVKISYVGYPTVWLSEV